MRENKHKGYLLTIGLLTVFLICALTAWGIEYQRKVPASPDGIPGCTSHSEECPEEENPDAGENIGTGKEPANTDSELRPFHPVATIGDLVITLKEFYLYSDRHYGSSILNQMLDEKVLEIEAEQMGLTVTPEEIKRELLRMQEGYESETDFYQTMKDQLGMNQEAITRDIRHTLLREKVATQGIIITDDELQNYLDQRPEEVMSGTELHIQQIVLDDKEEAEEVMRELSRGLRFEDLAAAYSDDTLFPNGDLGWIEWDDPFLPAELLQQAHKMKMGEISPIISLPDDTYAIIKLQGKKSLSQEEQEILMERIRMELALSQAPSMQELLIQLRIKHNVSVIDPIYRK
jgi:foldase protein PrsA